jgi:hypothetical protein
VGGIHIINFHVGFDVGICLKLNTKNLKIRVIFSPP